MQAGGQPRPSLLREKIERRKIKQLHKVKADGGCGVSSGQAREKKVKDLLVWCLQSQTHCCGVLVSQKARAFLWGKIHIYTSSLRLRALKCAVRNRYSPAAAVLFLASVNCILSWFQSLFTDLWARIDHPFPNLQSAGSTPGKAGQEDQRLVPSPSPFFAKQGWHFKRKRPCSLPQVLEQWLRGFAQGERHARSTQSLKFSSKELILFRTKCGAFQV